MKTTPYYIFLFLIVCATSRAAADDSASRLAPTDIAVEVSGTAATGKYAPLWLTANRYGLGSVNTASAYQRAYALRDIEADSARRWRLGYGLDLAVAEGHERIGIVQQAYVEAAWKVLHLTVGAKQQPMETHSSELTSGDIMLGINARPIPQVRLDVDWFGIPGTKRWWMWKFYGSYGFTTDGRWQQQWVAPGERYARHMLYHEKGLFWQFGRPDRLPLTYEFGLRMATQFGGTTYDVRTRRLDDGAANTIKHSSNLRAFWNALICSGSDATDGTDPNTSGNVLGSYVMQLRYWGERWWGRAYFERFFEDQSMLTVQYGVRDMLIGGEVFLPKNRFVSAAVLEWLTTTNQSGAVYHDYTPNIPDKMNGRDGYYNHLLYPGWQYYGHSIGNPLLTSPLYNEALGRDGVLQFFNNRVRALHFGLSGDPAPQWHWRLMASLTRNWGTHDIPLSDPHMHQNYFLAEAAYSPEWAKGLNIKMALAMDQGQVLGNTFGAQLTLKYGFGCTKANKEE